MLLFILATQRRSAGWLGWWLFLGVHNLAMPAHAGDLESWSRQVIEESSFKVRLSAALQLGRLGDRRAVPVLTRALGDENAAVRSIAANALARVVDRRVDAAAREQALAALRHLADDDNQRAQDAARAAITALEVVQRIAKPRSPKDGIFVQIEPIADATGTFDEDTLARLTAAGEDAVLAAHDLFLVEWPGKEPSRKQLKNAGARAVAVMATLSSLDVSENDRRAQIECKLHLILASYPERAARTFVDGKAKLEVGNQAASIARAKRRCARDIVTHLMGKRIVADLLTTAR
jgi:hypothetical protein